MTPTWQLPREDGDADRHAGFLAQTPHRPVTVRHCPMVSNQKTPTQHGSNRMATDDGAVFLKALLRRRRRLFRADAPAFPRLCNTTAAPPTACEPPSPSVFSDPARLRQTRRGVVCHGGKVARGDMTHRIATERVYCDARQRSVRPCISPRPSPADTEAVPEGPTSVLEPFTRTQDEANASFSQEHLRWDANGQPRPGPPLPHAPPAERERQRLPSPKTPPKPPAHQRARSCTPTAGSVP